ncbi:Igf-Like Family Receptor 1 [Manis pentadactyla]|nr:Igf-Like Family Receptor 1 [Manis pentadactyla]
MSLSGPRRPPSLPIGGEDHGTWKLSLSGEGCPSGSVGSPFGSGSLPLPLPGAPRGRSSWRCRILTAAFPRVCLPKCLKDQISFTSSLKIMEIQCYKK